MNAPKKLFREASLERLSSPDKLDQLMLVTSRRAWFALSALILAVALAVAWGFLGSIPTRVQGQGVLMKTGGIQSVAVTASGRISDLSVNLGDEVRQGQLVARLAQPELLDQMRVKRAEIDGLQGQLEWLLNFRQQQDVLQDDYLEQRRLNLEELVRINESRYRIQQELETAGLITRQELLQTGQRIEDAKAELSQLELTNLESDQQITSRIQALELQIAQAESQLNSLVSQYESAVQVISPYAGRVVEIQANTGQPVAAGAEIMNLERIGRDIKSLEGTIFISAAQGKRVEPGMEVLISPSGIRREEFGYMVGYVTSVSEFPATYQGMMRTLSNDTLVRDLLAGGAVFEVKADLIPNPELPSGFVWSSGKGPDEEIRSGSLASAQITVQEQRPITLVIPTLRSWLGI